MTTLDHIDEHLFRTVADHRRREALRYVQENGQTTLDELAGHISSADGDPTAGTSEPLAVTLHHLHLPQLDAAGLIEYDEVTHIITPTIDEDEPALELLSIVEDRGDQ